MIKTKKLEIFDANLRRFIESNTTNKKENLSLSLMNRKELVKFYRRMNEKIIRGKEIPIKQKKPETNLSYLEMKNIPERKLSFKNEFVILKCSKSLKKTKEEMRYFERDKTQKEINENENDKINYLELEKKISLIKENKNSLFEKYNVDSMIKNFNLLINEKEKKKTFKLNKKYFFLTKNELNELETNINGEENLKLISHFKTLYLTAEEISFKPLYKTNFSSQNSIKINVEKHKLCLE